MEPVTAPGNRLPGLFIISGGQTGVDRGALDAALAAGVPHGGWCPRGRKAEDGRIPDRYQLQELAAASYAARTEQNVVDSDGTLILCHGGLTGGTALTRRLARLHHRPLMIVDLRTQNEVAPVIQWIQQHRIVRLNVAGPRESQSPGIQAKAEAFIRELVSYR